MPVNSEPGGAEFLDQFEISRGGLHDARADLAELLVERGSPGLIGGRTVPRHDEFIGAKIAIETRKIHPDLFLVDLPGPVLALTEELGADPADVGRVVPDVKRGLAGGLTGFAGIHGPAREKAAAAVQ